MRSKMETRLTLALAVVLTVGVGINIAQANTVTLDSLIANNGTVTLGDKIFSNFTFSVNGSGAFAPTSASGINVTGLVLDPMHEVLTFSGGFNAGIGGLAGSGDYLIGYSVATSNGQPLIKDIQLSFNGVVISPIASATVTETAFSGLNVVGQVVVNTPDNLSSYPVNLTGGPFGSVRVVKDIQLIALAGGQVQISAINQVISQVPEPGSVLLLGSGLLGMGLWGLKRRKAEQGRIDRACFAFQKV